MNLPNVSKNFVQERAGVLAVAAEINRIGLIWRETPMADVGIDGQIELVNGEGYATGQLVAVQIKSGLSYFHDHGHEWHFYPENKHRFYWERFPLPVIIMLHSPEEQLTYWTDARQFLRSPQLSQLKYIAIPKQNKLQAATSSDVFTTVGVVSDRILPIEEVLQQMIMFRSPNASFPLSYFDLFANGLTNIVRSLYFSMDLVTEIGEFMLDMEDSVLGLGIGYDEYNFLFNYMQFLVQQHIANIDFSDCLIDWYDRQMVPQFIAPLTSRGRELVKYISDTQDRLALEQKIQVTANTRVAQEGLIRMRFTPTHYARISLIKTFQNVISQTLAQQLDRE